MININRILGLNEQGNTQLQLGEAEVMSNWRLVDEYKARVVEGYKELFSSISTGKPIRGMWYGEINNTYHLLFTCNGGIYDDTTRSATGYDSIDTTTYTNVDVVKTTAITPAIAGTIGIDGIAIVKNSSNVQLSEIAQASIDNLASVGKFYYHTDKTIWLVVEKGLYTNIALARTGLGTTTVYYKFGTLAAAYTNFFFFDSKIYVQNGMKYYKWDGIGSLTEVTGYVPIIAIVTPPAGGGTVYEGINLLTGERRQWFSGDSTATLFQCAETDLTSIDYVKNLITGVNYTLTTDYTVNLTNGTVTFAIAPISLANNVEIKWTKGVGNRSSIEKCRGSLTYNGASDTRLFMWGNTDFQNRRYHSGLADVNNSGFAVPSAEYFPAVNYYDIGSNENAITDIVKQYDRQIIFTDGGKTFYSYYETGPTFPVHPLNDAIGNIAFGQSRIILNNPFTVWNGIYQWTATTVRDERNATYMSKRVQNTINNVTLAQGVTAITVDCERKGEYWVSIGANVLIYNYRLDAWYKLLLTDSPSCYIEIDGALYFGTSNGQIMKFEDSLRSFNGANIVAELYMGFTDAGVPNRTKYIEESHIALKSESHVKLNVYWETNKKMPKDEPEVIGYNNLNFDDINFDDWSFNGNYNPQPFKVKTKAKKWVYYRHIFKSDSNYYTAQILEITGEPNITGISK